jgi:hypothetical protein
MQGAFTALREQGPDRELAEFDVEEAILVFVGLTFGPVSYRDTLLRSMGRDLAAPSERRRLTELAVRQLMHLIADEP